MSNSLDHNLWDDTYERQTIGRREKRRREEGENSRILYFYSTSRKSRHPHFHGGTADGNHAYRVCSVHAHGRVHSSIVSFDESGVCLPVWKCFSLFFFLFCALWFYFLRDLFSPYLPSFSPPPHYASWIFAISSRNNNCTYVLQALCTCSYSQERGQTAQKFSLLLHLFPISRYPFMKFVLLLLLLPFPLSTFFLVEEADAGQSVDDE